jgi:hypothetical protein
LQDHFKLRDRAPNRLGGRRTRFWLDIYKSTQIGEVTDRDATVIVGDPRFTQKVKGGTIRPVSAKALAIPLTAEAHGRRPETLEREMGVKLFVVPRDFGSGLLAAALGQGNGQRIKAFYVLRKSVTQRADPLALPNLAALQRAAIEAAQRQINTQLQSA